MNSAYTVDYETNRLGQFTISGPDGPTLEKFCHFDEADMYCAKMNEAHLQKEMELQEGVEPQSKAMAFTVPAAPEKSDGSDARYYDVPPEAKELQDLISYKNMNAQIGAVFSECYRYGQAEHCDKLRGAKKMKFYIDAELLRLQMYEGGE